MTKIFYSWQSDRPKTTGRNLIGRALEKAIEQLGDDLELDKAIREDIELDSDTKGVPGSPPIVDTILKKISRAAVFVADLTFVGIRCSNRPTPNPNVLIEYGWALKELGHNQIIAVMNTAHGEPTRESLPFDLSHLRNPVLYSCPDNADEETRMSVKADLTKILAGAIRTVLTSDEYRSSLPTPPEPPKFEPRVSPHNDGKFRSRGEPIGIEHGRLSANEELFSGDGPATWLRLMPIYDPGKTWLVSEIENTATFNQRILLPLDTRFSGFSYVRGDDGFGVYGMGRTDTISSVAYWFKSGEIWSFDTEFVNRTSEHKAIPLDEKHFAETLEMYGRFLGHLAIDPPYRWMAGIDGVKGRGLWIPGQIGQRPHGMVQRETISAEGHYDPSQQSAQEALEPFFAEVFDACGLPRSTGRG